MVKWLSPPPGHEFCHQRSRLKEKYYTNIYIYIIIKKKKKKRCFVYIFCHVDFKYLTILYPFFIFLIFGVLAAFSSSEFHDVNFSSSEFHDVNFIKDMAKICNKNCMCSSPQALAAP